MAKSNKLTASNVPARKAAAKAAPATTERKVVGIPTEEQKSKARAKAAAKPHGGKPGSATSAQSAKYAEGELTKAAPAKRTVSPDKITESKNTTDGNYDAVTAGGRSITIRKSMLTGELNKLAIVGGSMKAVEEYIKQHTPEAKLARGLSGKDAPQSALAAAASRKPAKALEAPVKTGKTERVKAAKEAKAQGGKLDLTAKLASVAPNPKKAGTSTFTRYAAAYKVGRTLADVLKHTTRADIDWDLKRGFITLG